MSDINVHNSHAGVNRELIDNALRFRRLYEQALAGVLGSNHPDGASIMGRVSGDWLAAEDKLNFEEYAIYQAEWRAEKEEGVKAR